MSEPGVHVADIAILAGASQKIVWVSPEKLRF